MRNPIIGSVLGVITLFMTYLLAGASYACACEPKTTGYFKQMGTAIATSTRLRSRIGLEKSLTGVNGNPGKGRQVMIDRKRGNCLACHRISSMSDQPFHGDLGPSLDRVALRYSEPQLRQMMVDARAYFPKTIMPPFFEKKGMHRVRKKNQNKTILSGQEIEDVVAFLNTLR